MVKWSEGIKAGTELQEGQSRQQEGQSRQALDAMTTTPAATATTTATDALVDLSMESNKFVCFTGVKA